METIEIPQISFFVNPVLQALKELGGSGSNKEIGRHRNVVTHLGNNGTLYFSLTQDSVCSKLDRKSLAII
jgi:hypothetical protein